MHKISPRMPKRRVAHVRASKLIPSDTREVHFVWRGKSMIARGPFKIHEARLVAHSIARRLNVRDVSLDQTMIRSDMGELYRALWGDDDGFRQEPVYVFGPRSAHVGVGMDPKARQAATKREVTAAKAILSAYK